MFIDICEKVKSDVTSINPLSVSQWMNKQISHICTVRTKQVFFEKESFTFMEISLELNIHNSHKTNGYVHTQRLIRVKSASCIVGFKLNWADSKFDHFFILWNHIEKWLLKNFPLTRIRGKENSVKILDDGVIWWPSGFWAFVIILAM